LKEQKAAVVAGLKKEETSLTKAIEQLKEQKAAVVAGLKKEETSLTKAIEQLKEQKANQNKAVAGLKEEEAALTKSIEKLTKENAGQEKLAVIVKGFKNVEWINLESVGRHLPLTRNGEPPVTIDLKEVFKGKAPMGYTLSIVPPLPAELKNKDTRLKYRLRSPMQVNDPKDGTTKLHVSLEATLGDEKPKSYELGIFTVKDGNLTFTGEASKGEPGEAMKQCYQLLQNRLLEVKLADGRQCLIALRRCALVKQESVVVQLKESAKDELKMGDLIESIEELGKPPKRPRLYCGPLFLEATLSDKGDPKFKIVNESFDLFVNVNGRRVNIARIGPKQ
jgi:hypothetical protein